MKTVTLTLILTLALGCLVLPTSTFFSLSSWLPSGSPYTWWVMNFTLPEYRRDPSTWPPQYFKDTKDTYNITFQRDRKTIWGHPEIQCSESESTAGCVDFVLEDWVCTITGGVDGRNTTCAPSTAWKDPPFPTLTLVIGKRGFTCNVSTVNGDLYIQKRSCTIEYDVHHYVNESTASSPLPLPPQTNGTETETDCHPWMNEFNRLKKLKMREDICQPQMGIGGMLQEFQEGRGTGKF